MSITKTEFMEVATDLVEEYFPKGKTKMRGEAMVLVAMLMIYLKDRDLIIEE